MRQTTERKKGSWEGFPELENTIWQCSECEQIIDWDGETNPLEIGFYNFCPVCGADMRGEQ